MAGWGLLGGFLGAHEGHDGPWEPQPVPPAVEHAPGPLPDRVVLTWEGDPATTQAVTWRTDPTVPHGVAEIAVANDNGRALVPARVEGETTRFESDLGTAHYHTVRFTGLVPDTLYAYRVGDGVNWSEYFHFQTASQEPRAFQFIYFGDAQNDIKTHWSRVFREAFRGAPRAAFTLHAGDLINEDAADAEWGEWFGAPAWVNGMVPAIATPGNHEYFRINLGPREERLWTAKDWRVLALRVQWEDLPEDAAGPPRTRLTARDEAGRQAVVEYGEDDAITAVGGDILGLAGYRPEDLLGTEVDKAPLRDRLQNPGIPMVSRHWRPQFTFPVGQGAPAGLEETCYFIDYQGTRIISLDSNKEQRAQVEWLRGVLQNNPARWTILTFHHPIFSPASDRDNKELRDLWKPLFDQFKVDLVLTGHDHTYARTGDLSGRKPDRNIPTGYQQAYDPAVGTVYVVSVSGPKMYAITKDDFAVRHAEDTQLFQIITVEEAELRYEARTATNVLYDAFTLRKRGAGKPNELVELLPPENRRR